MRRAPGNDQAIACESAARRMEKVWCAAAGVWLETGHVLGTSGYEKVATLRTRRVSQLAAEEAAQRALCASLSQRIGTLKSEKARAKATASYRLAAAKLRRIRKKMPAAGEALLKARNDVAGESAQRKAEFWQQRVDTPEYLAALRIQERKRVSQRRLEQAQREDDLKIYHPLLRDRLPRSAIMAALDSMRAAVDATVEAARHVLAK